MDLEIWSISFWGSWIHLGAIHLNAKRIPGQFCILFSRDPTDLAMRWIHLGAIHLNAKRIPGQFCILFSRDPTDLAMSHYLFLFGAFGVPKLGVEGVALSTVIGRTAVVGIFIYLIIKRSRVRIIRRLNFLWCIPCHSEQKSQRDRRV